MAPKLQPKTPGAKGVEHVVDRQVEKALGALDGRRPLTDETVHDARKRLKRARAGLRLLRAALGNRAYRRENRALRDAARPLSEARDAKVLVETFDELELDGATNTRRFRTTLVTQRKEAKHKAQNPRRVASVLGELRSSRKRVGRVRMRRHGWSAIGPGL